MSGYALGILVLLSFNVIAAYAVYLPLSAGQLNLGIAGFMVIGAYSASFLTNTLQWPVFAAVASGAGAAAAVAVTMAIPILRTQGIYLALATFALGQVIAAVFLNLDVTGGAAGYPVAAHIEPTVVIISAAAVIIFMAYLSTTRFALYLTAIKSDALVADLMGIRVQPMRVAALGIGAAIAGMGGGLYAHYFNYIEAQYFGVMLSTYTVLFVLLGGTQTVWGPLIGAIAFTVVPELLRSSQQWRYALFAIFIIVFMAVRPQGIVTAGLFERLRRPHLKAGADL